MLLCSSSDVVVFDLVVCWLAMSFVLRGTPRSKKKRSNSRDESGYVCLKTFFFTEGVGANLGYCSVRALTIN